MFVKRVRCVYSLIPVLRTFFPYCDRPTIRHPNHLLLVLYFCQVNWPIFCSLYVSLYLFFRSFHVSLYLSFWSFNVSLYSSFWSFHVSLYLSFWSFHVSLYLSFLSFHVSPSLYISLETEQEVENKYDLCLHLMLVCNINEYRYAVRDVADIIKVEPIYMYISAVDHARKFSSYDHLLSVNQSFNIVIHE